MRILILTIGIVMILALPARAEQDISLAGPAGVLAATLTMPDNPKAALLILPGSGPTDRNGNSPLGINAQPYRLLADALTSQGIATLRADKRGIGASQGDGNAVTLSLYAQDALVMIQHLRVETQQDCVWLAGHSEGGLIAMKIASVSDDICGLILLATPGRTISVIMLDQLRAVPSLKPHMPDIEDAILSLITGREIPADEMSGPVLSIFAPAIQPFLIDLFAHDPVQMSAGISKPVLVVQGDNDLQITPQDAELLVQNLPNGTQFLIAGMTHMLKIAPAGDQAANLATYSDADLALPSALTTRIAEFVLGQTP